MSLRNYSPPRQDIAAGALTFAVRGLNVTDLAVLIEAHAPVLVATYKTFESALKETESDGAAISRSVMTFMHQFPYVAADIIAMAADEPDSVNNVRALPFPVQVAALSATLRLTFEAGGGVGNFVAMLRELAGSMGVTIPTSLPPAFQKVKSNAGA